MMKSVLLALSLLALTNGMAAAAEDPEQKSKKSKHARAAVVVLGQLGIDHPEVAEFVEYVDSKVTKNRVWIAQDRMMDGTWSISYRLKEERDSPIGKKGLVLQFNPDDSNWEYAAGRGGAMVSYKLKF